MLFVVLSITIVGLDCLTKYLTLLYLKPLPNHVSFYSLHYPYGGLGIFENKLGISFSLNYTTNYGAAWGILAGYTHLLVIFRLCLIFALIIYASFYNNQNRFKLPLSLIIAGALGNILDYFLYGYVIDMFHFTFWGYDYPVFNVADISIFCGIILYFIFSYIKTSETIDTSHDPLS